MFELDGAFDDDTPELDPSEEEGLFEELNAFDELPCELDAGTEELGLVDGIAEEEGLGEDGARLDNPEDDLGTFEELP